MKSQSASVSSAADRDAAEASGVVDQAVKAVRAALPLRETCAGCRRPFRDRLETAAPIRILRPSRALLSPTRRSVSRRDSRLDTAAARSRGRCAWRLLSLIRFGLSSMVQTTGSPCTSISSGSTPSRAGSGNRPRPVGPQPEESGAGTEQSGNNADGARAPGLRRHSGARHRKHHRRPLHRLHGRKHAAAKFVGDVPQQLRHVEHRADSDGRARDREKQQRQSGNRASG